MNAAEIVEVASSPQTVTSALTGIAVVATIISVSMPFISGDNLAKRMKAVANERERLRLRERAAGKGGLRYQPKEYMKNVVDRFSLSKWLNAEGVKLKLANAGYRGPQAEVAFLFFRLVTPIAFVVAAALYLFAVDDFGLNVAFKFGVLLLMIYVGVKTPEIFLTNTITKRQLSMKRAFPDSLDLLLICVESGMSIEHSFRKASQEIGAQSVELAEEFALTTAELSYLPDRRTAYQNLGLRTGLENIKQIGTVLIQAEKYGTPLAKALRSSAQESRDNRMIEAEKMAAALPPKLTVPMIVFFLPVLLVVVIAPAIIQLFDLKT
ncbi:MAG TPA: type II secretion system F family protein [Methylocystis sp.]|nr:type II secretion system F family protein [Methylocystis sp.]